MLGTRHEPFCDGDQGWEIVIWQSGDKVCVLQGQSDQATPAFSYHSAFRVTRESYDRAWVDVLQQARDTGQAFDRLEDAFADPLRVKHLVLGHQGLNELPDDFSRFRNLETLNAYLNNLTCLPDDIGHLTKLRDIDLRFNRIAELPESFQNLVSLKSINLAENAISTIPSWIASMTSLTVFFVPGCPVPERQRADLFRRRPDIEIDHERSPHR